ncbi:26035_t:CDS:1 [Gigaspora margarita]|uniref:26035_t:CDS:1 n=1 Tax=Gigaspora margarita TaxID=4874 RepID=A0ABM8VVU8_GIGMA|nr:26035_t:CDS:1 [Gigaspora margarita]
MFFYHFEESLNRPKSIPFKGIISQERINYVIRNIIDQQTLEKINKTVVLPLHQLIAPSKNRRGHQISRPQNSFVLYRRNLSAAITKTNNATNNLAINKTNDATNNFKFISKEAAKNWSKESNEVKQLNELLADCAKQVHNMVYPHYSYKPKHKKFKKHFKILKSSLASQDIPLACPFPKNLDTRKKNYLHPPILPLPIIEVDRNFTEYDKKVWGLVNDLNRV